MGTLALRWRNRAVFEGALHRDTNAKIVVAAAVTVSTILAFSAAGASGIFLGQVDRTEREEARNNANLLGIGMLMYANDNDDLFPYVQQSASAVALVRRYVTDRKVFDSSRAGGKDLLNLNIAGVANAAIDKSDQTPMWIESLPRKDIPFAACFVNSHARLIQPEERSSVLKAASRKFPRQKISRPLPANYLVNAK